MNYGTIERKKSWTTPSGQTIKDLLTLTFVDYQDYKYILFKVPHEYIARPDLICLDHYGNDDYTDIICKLNGISNPFELNEGMIIFLPEIHFMNAFSFDSDDIQVNSHKTNKSKAKISQTEKRKVNEALVNNPRYKIDKNRGVVIY